MNLSFLGLTTIAVLRLLDPLIPLVFHVPAGDHELRKCRSSSVLAPRSTQPRAWHTVGVREISVG